MYGNMDPIKKKPYFASMFFTIYTWILWGGTEIVQTSSCSGQVFDISVARNATDHTAISAWSKGPRQFTSPVVWAWVPHLSPTQRIHGIDAPETWLQRQTLHLLQDPSRSISRTLHTSWSNTGRLDCLVYYWFILIQNCAIFRHCCTAESYGQNNYEKIGPVKVPKDKHVWRRVISGGPYHWSGYNITI